MIQMTLAYIRSAMSSLHLDDSAQDAFEYLLVIGAVSVAVVFAMVTPVGSQIIDAVVAGVCGAIDTVVTQVECP